ncbi:LysR family transcriptional regulator [Falsirhodobacter halotolerans]|uniref:LysR family transcriptional regulator n=1 Tax=Falsirhodobacter halotolerans TaxID=1146892 RepID=UPI001FD0C4FA|nr:LysR family transcriptional regulator [Falsirhodobacter halotolerans]MCJ8140877.1 LysR family transcriptional regulator [Falsirhodobacter halotolerans]
MNIDLEDLRAFVATADTQSFRAAADIIHLSQPALTRRIQKLEASLGVALLERTTRRVSLTAVGRDFLPRARRLLDDLETSLLSVREIAAKRSGLVSIACIPTAAYYFLPEVMSAFTKDYPSIRFRIVDVGANEVLQSVLNREVDFGITLLGADDPDVAFDPLVEEPFLLACRRDHPLAGRASVSWDELADHRFITVGRTSGNRLIMDLALARAEVRPRPFFEVQHLSTSLGLVDAGLGVAALPRMSLPGDQHPTIAAIPLVAPEVTRTVGIVRVPGSSRSPAAEQFYGMLLSRWQAEG